MLRLPLTAVLIGLATAAAAQTPPAAAPADGLSFESWSVRARDRLMALDTDHDGRISQAEFAARPAMGRGGRARPGDAAGQPSAPDGSRLFDRLDTNHDGAIDAAEVNAMLAARFARLDANHDGLLTPDERRAMWRGNAPDK